MSQRCCGDKRVGFGFGKLIPCSKRGLSLLYLAQSLSPFNLTSIIALTAQVFDRQGGFATAYRIPREHMTQLAEVTVTR
jgi:hypothetical protein